MTRDLTVSLPPGRCEKAGKTAAVLRDLRRSVVESLAGR